MRTDLDAFSDAKIAVLENHGYLPADTAIRTHAPDLIAREAPLAVPPDGWTRCCFGGASSVAQGCGCSDAGGCVSVGM